MRSKAVHMRDHEVELELTEEKRRRQFIYECSDTVEQRMIPRGSNNERLSDVDTRNCYICKVAQYLAFREALLCAFTYVLVLYS